MNFNSDKFQMKGVKKDYLLELEVLNFFQFGRIKLEFKFRQEVVILVIWKMWWKLRVLGKGIVKSFKLISELYWGLKQVFRNLGVKSKVKLQLGLDQTRNQEALYQELELRGIFRWK